MDYFRREPRKQTIPEKYTGEIKKYINIKKKINLYIYN